MTKYLAKNSVYYVLGVHDEEIYIYTKKDKDATASLAVNRNAQWHWRLFSNGRLSADW